MLDLRRLCLAAALPLALGACAGTTGYPSLSPDQPGADIRLTRVSTAPLGVAEDQFYTLNVGDDCDPTSVAAQLNWATPNQAVIRVAPDRPISISGNVRIARTETNRTERGLAVYAYNCPRAVRFIPREGRTYVVSQQSPLGDGDCPLSIADADPLAPAPDVQPTTCVIPQDPRAQMQAPMRAAGTE